MTTYLSMNGTSDYLQLPSMTFNKLVMDIQVPRQVDATRAYFDGRTGVSFGYVQSTTSGTDTSGNGGVMTPYLNGTKESWNTAIVPDNVRCTFEIDFSSAYTDNITIFALSNYAQNQKGNIYDIKVYNGATLVAHYDMSTGTVNDQTGNGYNATLNGGTWVSSGTNISIASVAANTSTSAIVPAVSTQQQVTVPSVTANALANMLTPNISTNANTTINAVTATSTASVVNPTISTDANIMSVTGSASALALVPEVGSMTNVDITAPTANTSASANTPSVSTTRNVTITATVSGASASAIVPANVGVSTSATIAATVASLMVDALAPSISTTKSVNVQATASNASARANVPTLQRDMMIFAVVSGSQASALSPSIQLNVSTIVSKVYLKGSLQLSVTLKGSRELSTTLQGSRQLNATLRGSV